MAERKPKKDHDFNVTAFNIVQKATGETEESQEEPLNTEGKNPHAVALGRLGGKKGGKARATKLTPVVNQRNGTLFEPNTLA